MREFTSSSSKKPTRISKKILKFKSHESTNQNPANNFHLLRTGKVIKINPQVSKTNSSKSKTIEKNEKLLRLEDYQQIPMIPEIKLSASEFADPIRTIVKLREKYEEIGAIKISPPNNWKPPFCFEVDDRTITTRKQVIQDLTKGKAFDQRVEAFKKGDFEVMANKFKETYKYQHADDFKDQLVANELEYWHLVDNPSITRETAVEYAADLSSMKFGSGFPEVTEDVMKAKDPSNLNINSFNLNNISNAPDSLFQILKRKQDKISGISSPWMYMGMLFATFCWHVEDCYMYSANYMHKGEAKTWYIVPGKYKEKVESVIKRHYPDIFAKRPNILNQIILQLNPLQLIKEGIPVYKVHQKPRDFIITFPKAFHAGFSHGFNVSEAVNFVTFDWLSFLKESQRDYEKNHYSKKLIFPIDWLICENYWRMEESDLSAIVKNHLKEEFKEVLQNEARLRKIFWDKMRSLKEKVNVELMKVHHYDKTICFFCKNYSYLSFLKCDNCQKKHCISHGDKNCCDNRKMTLFVKLSDKELAI